jgi:predicted outer membrane repeat protein
MVNVRFVNGDPTIGANNPDTQQCPKGGYWGCTPVCPWLTIQYSVNQLANEGGGILYVATHQYDENVVMRGPTYSHISIVGDLTGKITKPVDAQFCEERPLITSPDPKRPVFHIFGGADDIRLENLNISKGKHGVHAEEVDVLNMIACCVHDNTSDNEAGAGFLFENCSHVLVKDCRVFDNKATHPMAGMGGGGMLYDCDTVTVEGSYFHSNNAQLAGGALRIDHCKNHAVRIEDNTFGDKDARTLAAGAVSTLHNKANFGGAISVDYCPIEVRIGIVKANRFFLNEADTSGGAVSVETSHCDIGQNDFFRNKAQQNGGGVYLHNGFKVVIRRTDFQENEAVSRNGGAIYASGEGIASGNVMTPLPGELNMTSVQLHANKATGGVGGGLCAETNVKVSVTGCKFFDKNQAQGGGGLYYAADKQNRELNITGSQFDSNSADVVGGGCRVDDGWATITDTRFTFNNAPKAGGLSFDGTRNPASAKLALDKCVFRSNQADQGGGAFIESTSTGAVHDNYVAGNEGGFYFLADLMKVLGFQHNAFYSNFTKTRRLEDIVSDSDTSKPAALTQVELANANQVNMAGVSVK